MDYKPVTAVWEITMGCNMRCKHCGSSCENALPGELTTDEALNLCEQLGELGFQWITMSGGEPTTRKDWNLIAQGLTRNKIIPNIITNGWLFDEDILKKAVDAGVNTIAISIDGLEETHDFIRKPGSYKRIMNSFELMQKSCTTCAAITTVNVMNIKELPLLREELVKRGVGAWQLQIGLPMGNMAYNKELTMDPSCVDEIIDFAYETNKGGFGIDLQLADCLGYYNRKELEARKASDPNSEYFWNGCNAGKYSMGILHNGDILGCTSIRDKKFIEGNVKVTPVKEIWDNPESFKWNRCMTKDQLTGLCGKCGYGETCLGGCANTRITMEKDLYSENKYCSYNYAISRAKKQLDSLEDINVLKAKAAKFLDAGNLQLTGVVLEKALQKDGNDYRLLSDYGFVSFMLGNYKDSESANRKVLSTYPDDAYAHKGLGLCLARQGNVEEGIQLLERAIELADEGFLDPYNDLAVVLFENNRCSDALDILEAGRKKSTDFKEKTQSFYEMILEAVKS